MQRFLATVPAEVASIVLAKEGCPVDAAAFHAVWETAEIRAATHKDFAQTQRWGDSSFPTLILEQETKLNLVTSGYTSMAAMLERVRPTLQQKLPQYLQPGCRPRIGNRYAICKNGVGKNCRRHGQCKTICSIKTCADRH